MVKLHDGVGYTGGGAGQANCWADCSQSADQYRGPAEVKRALNGESFKKYLIIKPLQYKQQHLLELMSIIRCTLFSN